MCQATIKDRDYGQRIETGRERTRKGHFQCQGPARSASERTVDGGRCVWLRVEPAFSNRHDAT